MEELLRSSVVDGGLTKTGAPYGLSNVDCFIIKTYNETRERMQKFIFVKYVYDISVSVTV